MQDKHSEVLSSSVSMIIEEVRGNQEECMTDGLGSKNSSFAGG
jgi:hypothetical protein